MKKFLKFLAAFSIWEFCGRYPVWAGALMMMGVGGLVASGALTPPTITPQPSAIFTQSNLYGNINAGLLPNGGTVGAFYRPSTVDNSFAIYHEFTLNPSSSNGWLFGSANSNTFGVSINGAQSPQLFIKRTPGAGWWLPTTAFNNGANATGSVSNAGYNSGIYTWTANDGCPTANGSGAREPVGAVILGNSAPSVWTIDPGFLCGQNSSGASPTVTFGNIPGAGSAQTGASSNLSCTSNSPVSGQVTVTTTWGVAHGLNPGQEFTLSGATNAGFNTTYAALSGSTGTTLVGTAAVGSGTCPASTDTVNLTGGSSNTVTVPTFTVSSAFSTQSGTGIQFKPGQRICGMFGELGADSTFPGAQFAKYTDIVGTDMPGSPAVSPWLNLGTATFTGYVVAGTQSAGNPAMTVTAMASTSISAASFSTSTGYATFTFSANPGLTIGSEFTVSGATTSGGGTFNLTYVAVSGTSGTTVVGNPLSGPVGVPQASSLTNSSTASTGSAVGVIMPGMQILGESGYVAPYGSYGSTGTGGTGTYGLTANPGSTTFTGSIPASSSTLTLGSTPSPFVVPGSNITLASPAYTGVVQTLNSGSGASGSTYTVSPANGASAITSATITNTGALWSSGTPGTIIAAEMQYYSAFAPAASAPFFTVTPYTQSAFLDFVNTFGLQSSLAAQQAGASATGWAGNMSNIGMYFGVFPNTNGTPSSSAFNSLCTKTTDPYSFASANGGTWHSLYKLNDPGIWADHSLAEFTGYTSGASGTSGGTATLNVSATQFGSLPGSGTAVISGPGLCANSVCSTVNLATDVVTFPSGVTSANLGSSGSPIAWAAGSYQPASPLQNIAVTGYISGSTMTVTAVPTGNATATFTGVYSGTQATGNLTTSSPTGTIGVGQCVWDDAAHISTYKPLCITGGSGSTWTVNGGTAGFNYYGAITSETMYSTAVNVRPGDMVMASAITTPIQVTGYGSLTPCATSGFPFCGTYTVSNPAGLTVGSSGSPVTLVMAGVQAGGAIAPGAALTVNNPGTGATYPVTNWSAMTGTLPFSGAYSTSLLHGTPTAIQAQISATPNGPALSGCSPCAWTNLSSSSIAAGAWSGNIVSIPAGGPYWISFRAANGTSFATLPNAVFVGAMIAGFGEGNAVDQTLSSLDSGTANQTYFQGVSSVVGFPIANNATNNSMSGTYMPGPPYLNNWVASVTPQISVDRYGVFPGSSSINEGLGMQLQNASAILSNAPVGSVDMYKNGSGFQSNFFGGVTQTQTIGLGTGSQTVFSSGAAYGGTLNTSGGALATTLANVTISTAGAMVVPGADFSAPTWGFLNVGQAVSDGAYSGFIVNGPSGGGGGTYTVSPAPGSPIGSSTVTVTHNNLEFNGAWGYGAQITGTVSSAVLTVSSVTNGVMAPLLTISDGTNSSTLSACLTGCDLRGSSQSSSTWRLSSNALNGDTSTTNFNVAPSGGALWPSVLVEPSAIPVYDEAAGDGTNPVIQVGTFQVLVNGTQECSDSSAFAYNIQVGSLSGSGCSGWVNYVTGSYAITFSSAPASNAAIVGEWTNIMTQNASGANEQIDLAGGSSATSGLLASTAAKTGGINAYLNGQQCGGAWPDAYVGAAKQMNYFFNNRMAGLHNGLSGQPQLMTGQWRGMGTAAMLDYFSFSANLDCEQFDQDQARLSNISGTIGSAGGSSGAYTAVLTLTSGATGTMWEGETLECNPYSTSCVLPLGTEIVSLASGTWGANGSTYNLITDSTVTSFAAAASAGTLALHNAIYYVPGTAAYVGPYNDLSMQNGAGGGYAVETGAGIIGAIRYGNRAGIEIGAALAGNPGLGSDPTLLRTTFTGCDADATVSPCFDVGSTYAASHAATWSGSTFTITGGLSAGARPFVPGMSLSCSGCNSGLVALSVSLPPTQSTTAGAGQIGQSFTITASGAIGGGGSGTLTGGCSGTAGTGSNCIDFGFAINTTGTYGTTAALNTCGVNGIQGTNTNLPSAAPYIYPNGSCTPTGVGAFVRGFRIGSAAITDSQVSNAGSVYDWGVDPGANQYGSVNQSNTFTCNIVAATIVQCVKGPTYSGGLFSAIGQWSSGSTYASYGDPNNAFSFMTSLIGYPGGQSFPFTAGSGYPNGHYTSGGTCTLNTSAGTQAMPPAMGFDVSGGAIVNVYPTTMGSSFFGTSGCTFPLSFSGTGTWTNGSPGTFTLSTISGGTIAIGEVLTFSGGAVLTIGNFYGKGLVGSPTNYSATCTGTCTTFGTAQSFTEGPQSGSGGAITTPPILAGSGPDGTGGFESVDADDNMSGDGLYDNSGVSGNPLAGKFAIPGGNQESPGLPVEPFGMRRGAQIVDLGAGSPGAAAPLLLDMPSFAPGRIN